MQKYTQQYETNYTTCKLLTVDHILDSHLRCEKDEFYIMLSCKVNMRREQKKNFKDH